MPYVSIVADNFIPPWTKWNSTSSFTHTDDNQERTKHNTEYTRPINFGSRCWDCWRGRLINAFQHTVNFVQLGPCSECVCVNGEGVVFFYVSWICVSVFVSASRRPYRFPRPTLSHERDCSTISPQCACKLVWNKYFLNGARMRRQTRENFPHWPGDLHITTLTLGSREYRGCLTRSVSIAS